MKIQIECSPEEMKSLFSCEQNANSGNRYNFSVTNGLKLETALKSIREMESRGEIQGNIKVDFLDVGVY